MLMLLMLLMLLWNLRQLHLVLGLTDMLHLLLEPRLLLLLLL